MARINNMEAMRVKPEVNQLLTLRVVRREHISPNFVRVTLGGGDIDRYAYMGYDQWFRLFIPVSEKSLTRLPQKLDTLSYLRFLTIAKTDRPVLRNYTVRAFREDGAAGRELDIDFVLHGSGDDGTAGPAASWADGCSVGDAVAILDEGIGYNPPAGVGAVVLLVCDETGLPAVAGVLASLPRGTRGIAIIEIPDAADRQVLDAPDGVEIEWVVRAAAHDVPGAAALAAAIARPLPDEPFFAWTVGEQSLPVTLRRHWVAAGVPKAHIAFCGYWRAGHAH